MKTAPNFAPPPAPYTSPLDSASLTSSASSIQTQAANSDAISASVVFVDTPAAEPVTSLYETAVPTN